MFGLALMVSLLARVPSVAGDSIIVDAGWNQPAGTWDSIQVIVRGWGADHGIERTLHQTFRVKPFPTRTRLAGPIDPTAQTPGDYKTSGTATWLVRICVGGWAKVNGATTYTEKACSAILPVTILYPKPAGATGGAWVSAWRK